MGWNDVWDHRVSYDTGNIVRWKSQIYRRDSSLYNAITTRPSFISAEPLTHIDNPENICDGYPSYGTSYATFYSLITEDGALKYRTGYFYTEFSTPVLPNHIFISYKIESLMGSVVIQEIITYEDDTGSTLSIECTDETDISSWYIQGDSLAYQKKISKLTLRIHPGLFAAASVNIYDMYVKSYAPPDESPDWYRLTGGHTCNF
jgi:hypothetical protein